MSRSIRLLPVLTALIFAALLCGNPALADPPATEASGPEPSGQELWDITQSKIFNGNIHKVLVQMNQSIWNQLHDDEKNNHCLKNDNIKWAHLRSFVVDDVAMKDVAMRVRGNTSRCIPRLQFSVVFDKTSKVFTKQGSEEWQEIHYDEATRAAIKDRTLHGLKELTLRRSFNDSSAENDSGNGMLAREFVATWAAAQAEGVAKTSVRGAPVYRTAYAIVEFQFCTDDADQTCANRFSRAYLIAEPIDKGFFKMRYDDSKPTYFSMSHGCALKGDMGLSTACLEPEYLKGKKYEDQDVEQQSQLSALLTGPDGLKTRIDAATSAAALGEVLDLDSIMNYAAVATTIGHWDSAYGNFNNDVLYLHQASGKWKLLTWDVDNTFDFDSRGGPTHHYSYADVANAPRPLFDKLFGTPELDARFRKHLATYLSALYGASGIGPLNTKIIEARDQYARKLNKQLVPGEQQNLQRAQEMFDYAKARFRSLRPQIQSR
jgi:spore coat protein CotH